MKKLLLIFVAIMLLMIPFIIADDEPVVAGEEVAPVEEAVVAPEPAPPKDGSGTGSAIWTFINSPVGVSIVGFVLATVLGKLFTAKPKWKALVLKYGPSIMRAIKTAEKKIPDGTENKGLARLDEALKYLIELEPNLEKVANVDLKTAISAVHSSAEAGGNLKKG